MAEKTEENPTGVGAPIGNTNSNKNNKLWADQNLYVALPQSAEEPALASLPKVKH